MITDESDTLVKRLVTRRRRHHVEVKYEVEEGDTASSQVKYEAEADTASPSHFITQVSRDLTQLPCIVEG